MFEAFLIFTLEVGGTMHCMWASREMYEEVKHTGRINLAPEREAPQWEFVKMVAFAPLEELYDFVAGSGRGKAPDFDPIA